METPPISWFSQEACPSDRRLQRTIKEIPVALRAGGLATRLCPITQTIPKALVEVAGRPFIDPSRTCRGKTAFAVGGGDLERNISPNLVRALEYAKKVGATVCGIVGRSGGYTAQLADACVNCAHRRHLPRLSILRKETGFSAGSDHRDPGNGP